MDPKSLKSIFNLAQQIAGDMKVENGANFDMASLIGQVTNSVSKAVTPEFIEEFKTNQTSGISKGKSKAGSSNETLRQKTADTVCNIEVPLRDFYFGKNKSVKVKVSKYNPETKEIETEKVKHTLEIKPGMTDCKIVHPDLGDCAENCLPGDIVFVLTTAKDEIWERDGDDLMITIPMDLFDCYNLDFQLEHINENTYHIQTDENTFDIKNPVKQIEGLGMPKYNPDPDAEQEYGDLYICFDVELPEYIPHERLELIKQLLSFDEDESENEDETSGEEGSDEETQTQTIKPDTQMEPIVETEAETGSESEPTN